MPPDSIIFRSLDACGQCDWGLVIGAGGGLSPVLAAVLHNASSVAVVANSSRLIRYELG